MKGIILAGGNGRRLNPLTDVTNKHLLPVYDKPMILYPLNTLLQTGIREVLIVTGREYAGGFIKLLGSGREFGARFMFEVQEDALGIAHALSLAEDFADGEDVAVILGDNIYEDNLVSPVNDFRSGAHVFLKETDDAQRFGVAEIKGDKIIGIEEKPEHPKSKYAVTGFYIYDSKVFDAVKTIKPSGRGELEITDVNNYYVNEGKMTYTMLDGEWTDSGTFESLYKANTIARNMVAAGKSTPFENLIQTRNKRGIKTKSNNPSHQYA